jgi:hypothetical protein
MEDWVGVRPVGNVVVAWNMPMEKITQYKSGGAVACFGDDGKQSAG